MNDSLTYQLLKIIHHNGNILEITIQGYEFGQVTFFLDALMQQGYVTYDENKKMTISDTGKAYINGYESSNDIKHYSKWILPQKDVWYKPMGKFDIYIVKKKK